MGRVNEPLFVPVYLVSVWLQVPWFRSRDAALFLSLGRDFQQFRMKKIRKFVPSNTIGGEFNKVVLTLTKFTTDDLLAMKHKWVHSINVLPSLDSQGREH
jgi:hypothetical protein